MTKRAMLFSVRFAPDELERIKRAKRKLESLEDEEISLNSFMVDAILKEAEEVEKM